MPKFDLDNYEQVEDRIVKFYKDYKDGCIKTDMVHYAGDMVVFKATLYKTPKDLEKGIYWTTGHAEETRGQGPVNRTSHLENCETSAIGRALANANYAAKGKRPSREEMAKVQRGGFKKQANTVAEAKSFVESTKSGQEAPLKSSANYECKDCGSVIKSEKVATFKSPRGVGYCFNCQKK